jgi:tRNA(His) 5'-end guanylyltransferase
VTPPAPPDLVAHVVATTGLTASVAGRVVSDVIGYFAETIEQYVRRRHRELHRNLTNDQIWTIIAAELAGRPVAVPRPTERQLRRIVYG